MNITINNENSMTAKTKSKKNLLEVKHLKTYYPVKGGFFGEQSVM